MKIKIDKFENFINMPQRAHYNDSGLDVFATESYTIQPHTVYCAPLGFGLRIPDGYDAVVHCKSGLSRNGIFAMNSPIDAGYQSSKDEKAEIHAILYNSTNEPFEIKKGMKIGQIVIRPVIYAELVEDLGEERVSGAFGSTGM